MFGIERTWDYRKEHYMLKRNKDNTAVICTHCEAVVEKGNPKLPDYAFFMGGVYIKQNLPCKPYKRPIAEVLPLDLNEKSVLSG